jgi:DNA repair protein RadC
MEAGKLLEIPLLDHLIFTDGAYLSMAEDDLM